MSLAINVLIHVALVTCWNVAAASGMCIAAVPRRPGTRGMATVVTLLSCFVISFLFLSFFLFLSIFFLEYCDVSVARVVMYRSAIVSRALGKAYHCVACLLYNWGI